MGALNPYTHKVFAPCKQVGDFAIYLGRKLPDGRMLGRNMIFAMLKKEQILRKDRMPYQSHSHHFNVTVKEGWSKGGIWTTTYVPFIKPTREEYFAKWTDKRLAQAQEIKDAAICAKAEVIKT